MPTLPAGAASTEVETAYPRAYALYVDLHQHPELSGEEVHTAARLAAQLRKLGYMVSEHVGGTGVGRDPEERAGEDGDAAHRARRAAGRGADGTAVCQHGAREGSGRT
jgi:metal-dependent amidase/aminoacylase/carboxypeptidase family protein